MTQKLQTCDHEKSAPLGLVEFLHTSQAGSGRHKCVICAYEAGRSAALSETPVSGRNEACAEGESAPVEVLAALPMSQAGQGRHKCAICAYSRGFRDYVEEQALYKEDLITYSNDRDSVERPPRDLIEIKRFGHHRRLERDPSIVRQIKKSLGDSCECCGIRMEDRYGEIGSGYIEAHHLIPLSKLAEGESRPVAAGDFAALCPNCHRMIHRLEDVSNIEQLRQLLRE